MEITSEVFQVDAEIIKSTLISSKNYNIEFTDYQPKKQYCIIYFCSNDLYYPNNSNSFHKQVLVNDKYEWRNKKIAIGCKHIFIRDIQKQWYLGGINHEINSPEKLLEFLIRETDGYKVITLGSSAGGFAAVIFGQLLHADRILSFNGQFEINSLLNNSSENINPLIFRFKNNKELRKWYDSRNFISKSDTIFYFQSGKSEWDCEQFEYISDLQINRILFNTKNHGIPFIQTNLIEVINMNMEELKLLTLSTHQPLSFSIHLIGFFPTVLSLVKILRYAIRKVYITIKIKRGHRL